MSARETSADRWRELTPRCAGSADAVFFPSATVATAARYEAAARVYCRPCPLRRDCLEGAMQAEGSVAADSRYGLHGGLTPDERHDLYVKRTSQEVAA